MNSHTRPGWSNRLLSLALLLPLIAAVPAVFAQGQTAPRLKISPGSQGQTAVSWSPDASGYVLQETTDLRACNWVDCASSQTGTPVLLPASSRTKFYRLAYVGPVTGDFQLGAPMMTQLVPQGGSISYDVLIFPLDGFNSPATLSVDGLPVGASGSFQPNPFCPPFDPGSPAKLTVNAGMNTPVGNYNLTVNATSGELRRQTWLTLMVLAANFELYPSISSRMIPPEATTSFPIFVSRTGDLPGPVNLSVSGLPSGATAVFQADPENAETSVLRISTTATVAVGKHALTITGTSGSMVRTTTVELTIAPLVDFSLGAPMMTMFVNQGDSTGFDLLVFSEGAFDGEVTFTVDQTPPGATAFFEPNPAYDPADFGKATTLYIATTKDTPGGGYNFTVTGTCGKLVRTTWLSLFVAAPGFDLFVPSVPSIAPGQSTTVPVTVNKTGGFTNAVNLTVAGLPSGCSFYWNDSPDGRPTLNVFTSLTTPVGTHMLTITGTSGGLVQTATTTLEVAPEDFTLAAGPGSDSVEQGESIVFTISVNALRGYDGYVKLAASGVPPGATASFNHNPIYTFSTLTITAGSSTPAGDYEVTVTGTEGALSRSTTILLTVREPRAYGLTITPASKTINAGSQTAFTMSVNRTGGYSEAVSLSVSGLPGGANASFEPNPMTIWDGTQGMLTIFTSSSTPAGTYPLTITALSETLVRTTTATLVIQAVAAPDFSLNPSPVNQSLTAGSSVTYTVGISRSGGFNGAVDLSVSGLPANTTGSFSPDPASGGSSTLTVVSGANASAGNSTLRITGTSGNLSRTANVSLSVLSPTAPDFSINTSPNTRTIAPGGVAGYDLVIQSFNGFTWNQSSWEIGGLPSSLSGLVYVPLPQNGPPFVNVTASPLTPSGTYPFTVTATLTGSKGTRTHSTTATVTVTPPDFSLKLSPATRITAPGGAVGFEVEITPIAGFYYSRSSWEVGPLPSGMSGDVFVPLPENGRPVFTVRTSSSLKTGSYPVTLTTTLSGGNGARTHSATATVVVSEPDFELSLSPASRTVSAGDVAGYTIVIEPIAGFSFSSSRWDVRGLPSGISSLVYVPLPGNGPPFVNVTTSSSSPKGTFTFTLEATLSGATGTRTHTATGTITVGP